MKSKYPLYFGIMSLILALAGLLRPDKPLSSSIPIVLGEHAGLFAFTFFAIGCGLIYSYYRSQQ